MPIRFNEPEAGTEETSTGVSPLAALLGVGGILGAAALARKPGMLGKLARGANIARMTSFLSGAAAVKNVLSNTGQAAITSAEEGSTNTLRQMLSRETLRDAIDAFKTGAQTGPVPGGTRMNPFGRILGATDVAAQKAFVRSGRTPEEALELTFQNPLPKEFRAFENPTAQYVFPFRRTPFNQFFRSAETLPGSEYSRAHPYIVGGSLAAGAAHGALTADEDYPVSLGLGAAGAGKLGMNYAFGALAGRRLAGGRGSGGLASAILPVSEYGVTQAFEEPLAPFEPEKIAGVRFIRKFVE